MPGDTLGFGTGKVPLHHDLCPGRMRQLRLLKQVSGFLEICLAMKWKRPACIRMSAQEG